MKKTQVALAALALVASTAALANVTVYGAVDASIANANNGKGSAAVATVSKGSVSKADAGLEGERSF